jgi:hypothetical protein
VTEPARTRTRRHPFAGAVLFGLAAFYSLALGVYGAVAIPVSGHVFLDAEDCRSPVMACFPPNYHTGLRVLSLVAGVVVALALGAASRRRTVRTRAP